MLASSLGLPLCVDSVTIENIKGLKPVEQATVCVDISVLHTMPNVILASLNGFTTSLARVYVQYLSQTDACSACHGLFHDAVDCERLSWIWKTENFLDDVTHGRRIKGTMDEHSDSEDDAGVVGPCNDKVRVVTPVIKLDMTYDSSIQVAEASRKKRERPRKFTVASSKHVNTVKRGRGRPRKKPVLKISDTSKIVDSPGTKTDCSSKKQLTSKEHLLEDSRRLGLSVVDIKKMVKLERHEHRDEQLQAQTRRSWRRLAKIGEGYFGVALDLFFIYVWSNCLGFL